MTMQFRTKVKMPEIPIEIQHTDCLWFMGSCFSNTISSCCFDYGFNIVSNPFGIVYNPISIADQLAICNKELEVSDSLFVERESMFFHYCFHSDLYASSKDLFSLSIDGIVDDLQKMASNNARHVFFITLGTAWVYALKDTNQIVANCHKQPSHSFNKNLISIEMIEHALNRMIKTIRNWVDHSEIIFTISPVRHIRDGLIENQRSKARLIDAVHNIVEKDVALHYFPSYEIITDELRDYRFYDKDMVHPSSLAVDFVWQMFREVFFNSETHQLGSRVSKIRKRMGHRFLHPHSPSAKVFHNETTEQVKQLLQTFPFLNAYALEKRSQ